MKKFVTILFMTLFAINVMAQQEVTKFLGIPIDGFKPQMRQNLIAKGYTPKHDASEEYFESMQSYIIDRILSKHSIINSIAEYNISTKDSNFVIMGSSYSDSEIFLDIKDNEINIKRQKLFKMKIIQLPLS